MEPVIEDVIVEEAAIDEVFAEDEDVVDEYIPSTEIDSQTTATSEE